MLYFNFLSTNFYTKSHIRSSIDSRKLPISLSFLVFLRELRMKEKNFSWNSLIFKWTYMNMNFTEKEKKDIENYKIIINILLFCSSQILLYVFFTILSLLLLVSHECLGTGCYIMTSLIFPRRELRRSREKRETSAQKWRSHRKMYRKIARYPCPK